VLSLTLTWREALPNGMSADVARVLRDHGYALDAGALLEALRHLAAAEATGQAARVSPPGAPS
jgi:hypothetical protein